MFQLCLFWTQTVLRYCKRKTNLDMSVPIFRWEIGKKVGFVWAIFHRLRERAGFSKASENEESLTSRMLDKCRIFFVICFWVFCFSSFSILLSGFISMLAGCVDSIIGWFLTPCFSAQGSKFTKRVSFLVTLFKMTMLKNHKKWKLKQIHDVHLAQTNTSWHLCKIENEVWMAANPFLSSTKFKFESTSFLFLLLLLLNSILTITFSHWISQCKTFLSWLISNTLANLQTRKKEKKRKNEGNCNTKCGL